MSASGYVVAAFAALGVFAALIAAYVALFVWLDGRRIRRMAEAFRRKEAERRKLEGGQAE